MNDQPPEPHHRQADPTHPARPRGLPRRVRGASLVRRETSGQLKAGVRHGAAMLGTPTVVQLKLVDGDQFITGSLDRSRSWLGQTPQVFLRDLLEKAYEGAMADHYARVSDDADLVAEYTGHRVKIVASEDYNIKITTRTDLLIADQIMAQADFQ